MSGSVVPRNGSVSDLLSRVQLDVGGISFASLGRTGGG